MREPFEGDLIEPRALTYHPNVKNEVNPVIDSVAIASTVEEASAAKSDKFQAGVRPYAQDYYVPDEAAKNCSELREAMELRGNIKFQVSA